VHHKNLAWCLGYGFQHASLRKVSGNLREKADVLHMGAFEQGPSLGWGNTGPLAAKTSMELLVPETSVSYDI
jgi:hypothetical protein